MPTKSSRKPVSNRSKKPARVPAKWRNLPAHGYGITPAMKSRPVVHRTPNEEIDERIFDDACELMPVPMSTFLAEHTAMLQDGYHSLRCDEWQVPCHNCGCEYMSYIEYTTRHRNGKPNLKVSRDFMLCPQCLHVSEQIFIIRDEEQAGLNTEARSFDSDAA